MITAKSLRNLEGDFVLLICWLAEQHFEVLQLFFDWVTRPFRRIHGQRMAWLQLDIYIIFRQVDRQPILMELAEHLFQMLVMVVYITNVDS